MITDLIQQELDSIIVIFTCLGLSAFFSSAETAITSLGAMKVKHLIDLKGKKAAHMKIWLTHPNRVLTTILIYNNAVNILASAIITQRVTYYLQSGVVGTATGITTCLVLIFGEIVPKSFAKTHHEKLAFHAMRIVQFSYYVSYPLVRLLSGFSELCIKLVSKGPKSQPLVTEEEIEFLVSEGNKAGIIGGLKKDIIEGAFDFDETRVKEIMTPRTSLTAAELNTPILTIHKMILESGHSRIPVYKESIDQMVGVVLAKDILAQAFQEKAQKLKALNLMREVPFAPESKSIMSVFKDLKRFKSHIAIIIDEYGGTAGIVTMEDILEEIVGEIQDEYDAEEAKILKIGDDQFEVTGSLSIDEFLDYFSLSIEDIPQDKREHNVETIAGLFTQMLEKMPEVGQKVILGPLELEVIEATNRRIDLIRARRIS